MQLLNDSGKFENELTHNYNSEATKNLAFRKYTMRLTENNKRRLGWHKFSDLSGMGNMSLRPFLNLPLKMYILTTDYVTDWLIFLH